MKLALNLFALTFLVGRVAGQCSLCPGGSDSITDPDYKITSLSPTCGDVEAELSSVKEKDCDAELLKKNVEFDFSSACCSDVSTQSIACPICEEGLFVYPDIQIPNATIPITCGEVETISTFVSDGDSFTCKQFKGIAKAVCCGDENGPIGGCGICPPQAALVLGKKVIPGTATTCKEYDTQMKVTDSCSRPDVNYDFQAFCGCTGVEVPNTCDFCYGNFADPDVEVPGSGGATCGDFERLTPFIEADACDIYTETCCSTPKPEPEDDSASQALSVLVLVTLSAVTIFSQL